MKKFAVAFAGFSLLFSLSQPSHAEKTLSGDEIKALVTNKTSDVVTVDGKSFRQYFAADGSSVRNNGMSSTWYVEGNKHCNTAAVNNPCATIRDNGDGTYARVLDNGGVIVTWTKIVDGKDF